METIRFTKNEAAARTIAAYYDTPPMLYVHSFGCQQNVNDGEKIKGVLTDIGFGLAARPEDADLIVFNTCAVRENAEKRVYGTLGALKAHKLQKFFIAAHNAEVTVDNNIRNRYVIFHNNFRFVIFFKGFLNTFFLNVLFLI